MRTFRTVFMRVFPAVAILLAVAMFLLRSIPEGLPSALYTLIPALATAAAVALTLALAVGLRGQTADTPDAAGGVLNRLLGVFDRPRVFTIGLILIGGGYLAINLIRLTYLQWYLNPDALSYLQIARDYAAGDFVVRGYWSPMISWLSAFPIALGTPPEYAMRLLVIAAGLGCIALVVVIAQRIGLSRAFQWMAAAMAAVLLLDIRELTADMVGGLFLLVYLTILHTTSIERNPLKFGAFAGVTAGLAYLARSYNFVFILAHLVIFVVWTMMRLRTIRPLIRFVPALVITMGIVSAPWIFLLSQRYGYPTLSTSAAHTRALIAPGAEGEASITCIGGWSLCPYPDDVMFPWEDHPVEIQPGYDWNIFASSENIVHALTTVLQNIRYFFSLNLGWALMGAFALFGVILLWNVRVYRAELLYWLATTALYVGGYMITFGSGGVRYYLVPFLLIFVMFAYTVQTAVAAARPRARWLIGGAAAALIAVSFAVPAFNAALDAWRSVRGAARTGECVIESVRDLDGLLTPPFASVDGIWRLNMDVAYHLQIRNVGLVTTFRSELEDTHAQILASGARSVLISNDSSIFATLQTEFGYQITSTVSVCGLPYTILTVPAQP